MVYRINISKDDEKNILVAKCYYHISGLEQNLDGDFIS